MNFAEASWSQNLTFHDILNHLAGNVSPEAPRETYTSLQAFLQDADPTTASYVKAWHYLPSSRGVQIGVPRGKAVTFSHCFSSFSAGWRESIFLCIISWSLCSRVWIVRALFHDFWGRQTRSLHQPLQDTSGQYPDYEFSLNLDNPSKSSMSPFE